MAKFISVDGTVNTIVHPDYVGTEIHEYGTDTLRRVANRLSRSTYDFASTTSNVGAYPYKLEDCMEIVRDFIMEYHIYLGDGYGARAYNPHVSTYVADGKCTLGSRYIAFTLRGKYYYVYANRRNNPIIMKIDSTTGEIVHHAPVDERWDKLYEYSLYPIYCVETGETDPDKLVWIGGSNGLPIVDMGQYISVDFLAEHGVSICPDCGAPMVSAYTYHDVYDYIQGDYVDVCRCHAHETTFCDGHHRREINAGEYHHVDDGYFCDEAYANMNTFTCSCGRETQSPRTYVDEITGATTDMCPTCYRNAMRGRIDWDNVSGLLSYGTKPRITFFDKDGASLTCREPLSIGIEDELDQAHECDSDQSSSAPDRAARAIMRKFRGEIYCKYDGSLEYGCESVTMPHSIEAYESFDWDALFKITSDNNLLPNSTCGFHAHINNGGLGDTRTEQKRTAAKLAMVMDLHRDLFFQISLREERYDFDHWAGTSALEGRWEYYISRPCAACDYLYDRGYRYRAVNFTNDNTIEIRIFAATNERDIALANINVVYALVRMCKKTSMKSLYEMSSDDLCANLIKYAHNKDAVKKLLVEADVI